VNGVAPERGDPFHRVVERDAEGVQVTGRCVFAVDAFGRHVLERTDNRLLGGQRVIGMVAGGSEIREQNLATGGEQDVARLDITVDHTGIMGGLQGLQQCGGDGGGFGDGHRPVAVESLLQGSAGHQAHNDPGRPAVGDDIEDTDDIRMVAQPGGIAGLTFGTRDSLGVLRTRFGQREQHFLHRDIDLQPLVTRFPDGPEPTTTQLFD
jgi:hypothetical protein